MILNLQWLALNEWETAGGIAVVSVLLLSLIAVIGSRLLRAAPAIRDVLLLSALVACLAVPVVSLGVVITGKPLVAFPSHVKVRANPDSRPERELDEAQFVATSELRPSDEVDGRFLRRRIGTDTDVRIEESNALPIQTERTVTSSPKALSVPILSRDLAIMLMTLAWLSGTGVFAGFAIRSFSKANRIFRRSGGVSSGRSQSIAEAAAVIVGLRKLPTILHSCEVSTPVVIGFRIPVVVLPPWVDETVSDSELRDIFIHEFAHIRRRDPWTIGAQAAARCLFWPIVTIHWLNRELGRAREEVCDNFVLAHDDAIAYGELLLRLAERAIGPHPIGATIGILNWKGELESRVVSILDPKTSRATGTTRLVKLMMGSVFLLVATALCGTRFVTAQPSKDSATSTTEVTAATAEKQQVPRMRSSIDSVGDPLPTGALMRMGTSRFRPPTTVTELALSPDEETIVSIGNVLIAWNTKTGQELWRQNVDEVRLSMRGSGYGSRPLVFSRDGSRFYTPGDGGNVVIWETKSGSHETLTIQFPQEDANQRERSSRKATPSVDVTADGKLLAVGSFASLVVCDSQGQVRFEIVNTPVKPQVRDEQDRLAFSGPYSMGRFSPDGSLLACVGNERPDELRLFDVATGKELRQLTLNAKLVRFAFSPDGKQIAVTERDNAVRLYDVESGQRVWSKVIELKNVYENYTSAIAFSPDGKTIAACATDHSIYLLDPSTGDEIGKLVGHHWYPWALAFTANSQMLYSSGWDGVIRRWDMASRKQMELPVGFHATEVVTASPDGAVLAYQDDSSRIHLIDAEGGTERRQLVMPGMHFSQLLFSPNARLLAAGGSAGDQVQIVVWDAQSGEQVRFWNWPKGWDPHSTVEALCFTADGTRLAAAVFRQSSAYVWDMRSGDQLAKLKHSEVYGLSFTADGKTLVTAGWDSIVRFWETDTWSMHREFKDLKDNKLGGDTRMYTVCCSPHGDLIATAHLDGTVRVWQSDEMLLRSTFHNQGRFMYGAMDFSPDGLWLATGAAGGNVELWDARTGKKVLAVGQHQHYVYTVGFGREGRSLVSGSDDGLSYLWDLRPKDTPSAEDVTKLWELMADDDPEIAYYAMWAFSDASDRAVALLAEKLRQVKSVVDLDHLDKGRSADENKEMKRMKKLLVDKDPKVEADVTVIRAISVLAQLGTPAAKKLLKELADRGPEQPISRYASTALNRLNLAENR